MVVNDSIDSGIDLGVIDVCIFAQVSYIVDAVRCSPSRTETCGSDIDGVGSMVYGYYAILLVLGWCQKLDTPHCLQ